MLTVFQRIENLRLHQKWTWTETAKQMQMSRTMLHFLKVGRSDATESVIHRLEELERAAGIKLSGPTVQSFFRKFLQAQFGPRTYNECRDIASDLKEIIRAELRAKEAGDEIERRLGPTPTTAYAATSKPKKPKQ